MILVLLGLILYLVGAISLLVDEFKESIAWGLLGLFTQIGHLIFPYCTSTSARKASDTSCLA